MLVCLNCKTEFESGNQCPNCKSINIADFTKKRIIYKDNSYTKREWYINLSSYVKFSKDGIILKKIRDYIDYSYLHQIFEENCKKYTFLGLILPSIVFFALALTNLLAGLLMRETEYFVIDGTLQNIEVFLYFISGLYFVFFLIVSYLWIIKKQKCYIAMSKGQIRYIHITKEKYFNMVSIFNDFESKSKKE